MQASSVDLLKYMIDEANFINQQTGTVSFDEFEKNSILQRAAQRSLEVIGEASKQLSSSFKDQYTNPSWKEFSDIKDALMHRYYAVDLPFVYNICVSKVPNFQTAIKAILLLEENKSDNSI